jgi:hypothetical protein
MSGILIEVRRADFGKSVKGLADITLSLQEGEIHYPWPESHPEGG